MTAVIMENEDQDENSPAFIDECVQLASNEFKTEIKDHLAFLAARKPGSDINEVDAMIAKLRLYKLCLGPYTST